MAANGEWFFWMAVLLHCRKFGASGVAWRVGLLPDRKISAHRRCAIQKTRFVALLKGFTFAFVQVTVNVGKSDGCGENGKDTDCGQVLKAPLLRQSEI
jgi:hypothetical protein